MITIKSVIQKDLPIIQKLNHEVFIDNYQYDNDLILGWSITKPGRKYFQKLLQDTKIKNKACCFIAYNKQRPVGYIAARHRKVNYLKSLYLEIENMGVSPAFQSLGIGTKLIEEVFCWAKKQNYDQVYVNAYFKNTKAIKFYKSSGFRESDLSLIKKIE